MSGLQFSTAKKLPEGIESLIFSLCTEAAVMMTLKKSLLSISTPEGNIEKFVEANGDWMASHRVDLSTMEKSAWTWTDNSNVQFKAA